MLFLSALHGMHASANVTLTLCERSAAAREFWMIYRGPGYLAVLWFDSPRLELDWPHTGSLRRGGNLLTGGGGEGGGREAESYDRKKAWSSINHSILSGSNPLTARMCWLEKELSSNSSSIKLQKNVPHLRSEYWSFLTVLTSTFTRFVLVSLSLYWKFFYKWILIIFSDRKRRTGIKYIM